jgi:hypothetical protein
MRLRQVRSQMRDAASGLIVIEVDNDAELQSLRKGFEVTEKGGKKLRHGGMDVHGALNSGVRSASVHDVEEGMDGFVTPDSQ